LVEACADRLWLVADGTVKTFDGDMDDYRRFVLSGPEREVGRDSEPSGGQKAEARRAGVERRAPLAPLRKRLEAIEARMAKLTAAIQKIDAALEDGSAF
ncbi:ABC transporter ATP-binding protein, partial [Methylobacterium sp. D48H]